jgi:hypothetical protein
VSNKSKEGVAQARVRSAILRRGQGQEAKPINSHGFNSDRSIGLAIVLAIYFLPAATGTGKSNQSTVTGSLPDRLIGLAMVLATYAPQRRLVQDVEPN